MQAVAERLRRVEDRLERLLASGWRNAGAEAADLAGEADGLAALGLAHLAERLRAVAAAQSAAEALPAITLAAAACRLLRARLPTDAAPPGGWAHLLQAGEPPEAAAERLIPVARMAVGDGEAWACVRLRGGSGAEWLLLEPLLPGPSEAATASALARLAARFGRGKGAPASDGDTPADDWCPWLRRSVRGHLRWLARYPLGDAGEVEHCRMEGGDWPAPVDAGGEALTRFRHAVAAGKIEDDQPVIGSGGALRVRALDVRESETYTWVGEVAAAAFRATARDRVWAVAWCQAGLVAPLAVIVPGGLLGHGRLVHLVPGGPAEPL